MKIRLFFVSLLAVLALSCASASTPFKSEFFGPTKLSYGGLVVVVEKCHDIPSCVASLDTLISINEFDVEQEDQVKHFYKLNENLCKVFDLSLFEASELEVVLTQLAHYKTPPWREQLASYSGRGPVVQHVHLEATGLLDSTARTDTIWHKHISYGGTAKLNEYAHLMKGLSMLMAERIVFYGKNAAFEEALKQVMAENVAEDTVCKRFDASPPPGDGEIEGVNGPADGPPSDDEVLDDTDESADGPPSDDEVLDDTDESADDLSEEELNDEVGDSVDDLSDDELLGG